MNEEELISVVVPIYNVEKYLKKCIYSIINQTYRNIEIILVDDGSTDESGKICDSFMLTDNRIKVFHKKNGGLSDARNYGISKSKGKYITFVDSDDWLEIDAIEILYSLIVQYNVRMSICTYNVYKGNKKKNIKKNNETFELTTKECLSRMLVEDGFSVSSCAKMYDRNLFDGIEYPVNVLYEDNAVTYKLIMKCEKIVFNTRKIYNYNIRNDSITRKVFNIKKMDYIYESDKACNHIILRFPELHNECLYKKSVCRANTYKYILRKKNTPEEKKIMKDIRDFFVQNKKNILKNPFSIFKLKVFTFLILYAHWILKAVVRIYD